MSGTIITSSVIIFGILSGVVIARWNARRNSAPKIDGFPLIDEYIHKISKKKHMRVTIPDDKAQTSIGEPICEPIGEPIATYPA